MSVPQIKIKTKAPLAVRHAIEQSQKANEGGTVDVLPFFVSCFESENRIEAFFYASSSLNKKFLKKGMIIPSSEVIYTEPTDLFMMEDIKTENQYKALQYLHSIKGVMLRAIEDCGRLKYVKDHHREYFSDIATDFIKYLDTVTIEGLLSAKEFNWKGAKKFSTKKSNYDQRKRLTLCFLSLIKEKKLWHSV